MNGFVKNLWKYILPLLILVGIALIDFDFEIKNPFAKESVVDTIGVSDTEGVDSLVMDELDSLEMSLASTDSLRQDSSEPSQEVTTDYEYFKGDGDPQWRLVVASAKSEAGAQKMVERLAGDAEVVFIEEISAYRVVLQSFNDLSSAQIAFDQNMSRFPDAWLARF